VLDFTGKLTSLQFISPTKDPTTGSDKTLLQGGRKQGGYIPVAGDPANYSRASSSARDGPLAAPWPKTNPPHW